MSLYYISVRIAEGEDDMEKQEKVAYIKNKSRRSIRKDFSEVIITQQDYKAQPQ